MVNALIHRNYLELGSEVHIDMYDDRLEIFSPGGLVDGSSIKDVDVLNMASRRRNPILADIFSRLKYMERRGSGFKKIVSAYRKHEGYTEGMAPSFSTPRDSFVLTLPKFNVIGVEGVYVSNVDDTEVSHNAGGQKSGQKGGQNDTGKTIDTILQLIKENPSITRKVLAETVGISPSAIQKHINHLKNEGLIIRNGGDRDGYWEIKKVNDKKQIGFTYLTTGHTHKNHYKGWDGTYKGNKLPTSDYWYTISLDESDKTVQGHFTLIWE